MLLCRSEIGTLKSVAICSPATTIIKNQNDLFLHGFSEFIQYNILYDSYLKLQNIFNQNEVKVLNLSNYVPIEKEQIFSSCINRMFVRDVGAVVGNKLLIGKASLPSRKKEFGISEKILSNLFKNCVQVIENVVEFGDLLIINNNCIIVNFGVRSKIEALQDILKFSLSQGFYNLIILRIPSSYNRIHLDLTMNIVTEKACIADHKLALLRATLYKDGKKSFCDALVNIFKYLGIKTYWIANAESFIFNFLSINPETILINSKYHNIFRKILHESKIKTISIDLNEFEKAGGSVRCATLPLLRIC
jgi:arginine deiminase